MNYINPDAPVYISYAWANDANPDLEADVNTLCELMERNGIYYKRDKENLCPYRWSIHKAEEEIGEGCAVIVVVSEKYIKSLHCMHEWHLIRENGKISQRVFPIVMPGADITVKSKYKEYYNYFNERKQELVEQLAEGIIPLSNSESEAARFGYYLSDLAALYQYLADYNTAKHVVRDNDFAALILQLKLHIGGNTQQSSSAATVDNDEKIVSEPSTSASASKPEESPAPAEQPSEVSVDTNSKKLSVYDGLTQHQCQLLQKNLNKTREAFLEDERNNRNGNYAKDFLQDFRHPLDTDGVYDESTKDAVVALQRYLNAAMLFEVFLITDGIYGPKTEAAYDQWAKKANSKADKKVLDK